MRMVVGEKRRKWNGKPGKKRKKKEEKPIKRKSKNFIINFKMSKS